MGIAAEARTGDSFVSVLIDWSSHSYTKSTEPPPPRKVALMSRVGAASLMLLLSALMVVAYL